VTNFHANFGAENVSDRAIVPDYQLDLPAVVRQVRLCRSTLGAILDELECSEGRTGNIERIAESTTCVIGEIEALWEAIKQPH
jgi:hypothetical protein